MRQGVLQTLHVLLESAELLKAKTKKAKAIRSGVKYAKRFPRVSKFISRALSRSQRQAPECQAAQEDDFVHLLLPVQPLGLRSLHCVLSFFAQ